ncbi:hypothetical protein PENANT_c016G10296 [Penicillium antarcticum]|uniref:Yeast cell wall synthesis Kre9/Knh1-like N-terminal domain-containing protein n=1 Tax=Penicillium antarcticum TaxID=416450 RepID=A0A1V6Q3T2_9EURO|nr:hypothetical protein PENANT_c016G10296 [Penicillium antarcticum]
MRVNIVSLVAFATAAAGLVVTSPRIGEKIDPDRPLTIKWQSVQTDPDTFTIELVNQNVYPPTTEVVAQDVDSSKGSYMVKAKSFTDVDVGKGYQINFLSDSNGILAQSQQFGVTVPGALSSSSSGKETSTVLETSSGVDKRDDLFDFCFLGCFFYFFDDLLSHQCVYPYLVPYIFYFCLYPYNIFFYNELYSKWVDLFLIFCFIPFYLF